MDKNIDIILSFRKYLLEHISELSCRELNTIPPGYSNNIIWNLAHMNAVLQALCYRASQLPIITDSKRFVSYLPGTRPEGDLSDAEIKKIEDEMLTLVNKLREDLESGKFINYTKPEKIEKIYNIKVENIQDALKYVTHHEGIHFHAICRLKKVLKANP